ncbi:MAG: glutamate--tRNA ligase [Pseudomonadota bacterium]
MTVRTRFAPSPTGYLHIGGARTALYCYLYARRHNGQFILRVEDTDRERSTPEAVQAILDGMQWLGLEHDEGPIFQTERFDRYQEVIQQLLDEGKAYYCYCSKERIDKVREEQMARKDKPRYDGHCRDNPDAAVPGVKPVVRFKTPLDGTVIVEDQVRGHVAFDNTELDDLVIARADGTPTYNFTVVVDDMDMGITHVMRGDDHLNNTPRQIHIYNALGATPPSFAHVPMILGPDGAKLSKRHGATSVIEYRDQGYLPEAILNYLVRLGWSHGDQEVFSREEMISLFDIADVNQSASAINPDKLNWLNAHYIKTLPMPGLVDEFRWHLHRQGIAYSGGADEQAVFIALRERAKTLMEMANTSRFFYEPITAYEEKAARKNLKPEAAVVLERVIEGLEALETWEEGPIHEVVVAVSEALEVKLGKVAQPIRVAVTGTAVSPPIDVTLAVLGKEAVLERLAAAVTYAREATPPAR